MAMDLCKGYLDELAAAQEELNAERNRRFEGNRISSQEYNDCQNQVAMLWEWAVEAVEFVGNMKWSPSIESQGRRVIAATAGLDGLILCEKKPVAEVKKHTGSLKDMAIIVWSGEQPAEGTQLYRAWEPK